MQNNCLALGLLLICIQLSGCSNSPPAILPPTIGSGASKAALAQYDSNGNQLIDGEELAKAPALKNSLGRIDLNHDGAISDSELERRFAAWQEAKIGLITLLVTVRMDGQPLPGAIVSLTPEAFLGASVEPAQGVTGSRGNTSVQISNEPNKTGVQVGFYRVRISKPVDGKEIIPARYNERSELGIEVAQDSSDILGTTFEVKSR